MSESDLVHRLLRDLPEGASGDYMVPVFMIREAAAELTALRTQAATDRAEIERPTRERDEARDALAAWGKQHGEDALATLSRAEAAEAQRDALILSTADHVTRNSDLAARVETMTAALEKIKALLSYANQDNVSAAAAQSNLNSAWWQAHNALSAESGAEPQEPCRTCGDKRRVVSDYLDRTIPCPTCQGGN